MANIDVKKQTATEQKGMEKRATRTPSRYRRWDPFSFSLMPSDFFGSDPVSFMRRLQEEMDQRMTRLFGSEPLGQEGLWNPAVEVAQRNGHLQVHVELPGLQPEDVKVEVTDDAVIIQGERKHEHEAEQEGVYRSERRYGKFYREIPLPEGAKAEQAKAEFRDGVLKVTMPVPEQKESRRVIPIDNGQSSAQTA